MRPMDFTRDDTSDAPPVPAPAAPATQLSYAVATWLQRVDAAAHPKAKLNVAADADPKQTQYRLIYVMAPTSGGRHVALCLYKARLRGTGEVAAASPVSEVFSLLSAPPPFLAPGDEDLVRFFVAMRSGANSQTGSATEPRGKIGAALLQMLSDQEKLLWANSWADVGNGLVYPLKAGVLREANLAWREEGKGLRLGWQVAAAPGARHPGADQIDYMLPTDPPWYIDNLSWRVAAEPGGRRHPAGRPAGAGGAGAFADGQRQGARLATAAGARLATFDAAAAALAAALARRRGAAPHPDAGRGHAGRRQHVALA